MIKYLKLRRDLSIISVSGEGFTIDAVGRSTPDFITVLKALGVTVLMEDSPQVPSDAEEVQRLYDELQKAGGLEALVGTRFVGRVTYEPGQSPKLTGFGLDEETKDD